MTVSAEQKQRMAENLEKSFELLQTIMDLKLAYLKKIYPDKTEAQLQQKILLDVIAAKERQWESQKV